MRTLLIAIIALIPTIATAQSSGIELTPFVGARWGGIIQADQSDLFGIDAEVEASQSYGLSLTIPINYALQFELLANRQSSSFIAEEGLFGGEEVLGEVDVSYYQAGVLLEFPNRNIRPYVAAGLGAAQIDPQFGGARSEHRLAGNIGGGVKLFFTDHLAFRVEGRGFWVDTDDFEDDGCFRCDEQSEDFVQGEANVGLLIRF